MISAFSARAILGVVGLLGSGCGSPCALTGGSCLDLRVEGVGSYSDLKVELIYGSPSTTLIGLPTDPLTLPVNLRVIPPDGVVPSAVSCLRLNGGDNAVQPLTRGTLQIGGPPELAGSGMVVWADGQSAQATLRPIMLVRKDVVSGGGTGIPYLDFALGDFDGNGHPDIVNVLVTGVNATNYIGLYPNDGTPEGVAYAARVYAGPNVIAVTTGDVNGDGHIDAVMTSPGTMSWQIQLGLGNGKFVGSAAANGSMLSGMIVAGDFDHDGIADVASVNGTGLSFKFGHVSDGTTTPLGGGTTLTLPATARSLAMVDLDRDQKDDLLISSDSGNSLIVLYGNDQTAFALPKTYSIAPGPVDSAVGDVNGDGISDIVVADMNSGIDVLTGKGGRALTPAAAGGRALPCNPGLQQASALADMNGDGIPDLITGSSTANGQISIFAGNGDGTFKPPAIFPAVANLNKLIAADMDGDGRTDLVVGGYPTNTIAIFYNRSGS